MMQAIRIYGREDCIWCSRAKQFVEARGYAHSYTDVNEDEAAREYVLARVPVKSPPSFTLPQIFVGETLIGGFTELALKDKRGELQQMIGGA